MIAQRSPKTLEGRSLIKVSLFGMQNALFNRQSKAIEVVPSQGNDNDQRSQARGSKDIWHLQATYTPTAAEHIRFVC